jgi:hypothetical protein
MLEPTRLGLEVILMRLLCEVSEGERGAALIVKWREDWLGLEVILMRLLCEVSEGERGAALIVKWREAWLATCTVMSLPIQNSLLLIR